MLFTEPSECCQLRTFNTVSSEGSKCIVQLLKARQFALKTNRCAVMAWIIIQEQQNYPAIVRLKDVLTYVSMGIKRVLSIEKIIPKGEYE